jgi:ATP adenylyltransferase
MQIDTSLQNGRFASLLQGQQASSEVWDTVLLETDEFIVAPTKGSIIPDWLLLIPKRPALNYAEIVRSGLSNPIEFGATIASENFVWFEHGASHLGSEVGCGVDYAHVHLLLNPEFSMSMFAAEVAELSSRHLWGDVKTAEVYASVSASEDYYAFGDASNARLLTGKNLGRQFFRKVVANLVGEPDAWDYRSFPFDQNVMQTIRRFSQYQNAA